jgi:hypothetical protein
MSTNCAPTYNFYNCCCEDKSTSAPSGKISGFFVWPVDNALHPEAKAGLDPIYSAGIPIFIDSDKKGFVGLQPMHRKVRLAEISVMRVYLLNRIDIPSAYGGTVLLDLLVMDLFGAVLRTLTPVPLDYKALAEKVWTPIPLTSVAADLEIGAAEIVIARITFSAPDLPSPNNIRLQPALNAIGEFI